MMKLILKIKDKISQKISEHKRNITLGKLDSAGSYKLTEEEAREAALDMRKKSRKSKMHFVYGHRKYNDYGQIIGKVYYMPVCFTVRQYKMLINFLRDEFNNDISDYDIFAVHKGIWGN